MSILGAFAKLPKVAISFIMSVRPSAHPPALRSVRMLQIGS